MKIAKYHVLVLLSTSSVLAESPATIAKGLGDVWTLQTDVMKVTLSAIIPYSATSLRAYCLDREQILHLPGFPDTPPGVRKRNPRALKLEARLQILRR